MSTPTTPPLWSRRFAWPPVTGALLGAMTLLFAATTACGALRYPYLLTVLGAKDGERIAQGQLWRLAAGPLLHGGVGHLAVNLLVLWVLGRRLEATLGPARFLVLFTTTALAGSLASTWASPLASVGASGALFGCIGAWLALSWRLRERLALPLGRRLVWQAALWSCGAVAAGCFAERIDVAAHLGGLLAGVGLGLVLQPGPLTGEAPGRWRRPLRRGAALLAAGVLLAGVLGGVGQVVPIDWLPGGAETQRYRSADGTVSLSLAGPWTHQPGKAEARAGGLRLNDGSLAQLLLRRLPAPPAGEPLPDPLQQSLPAALRAGLQQVRGGLLEQGTVLGIWGGGLLLPPGGPPLRVTAATLRRGDQVWLLRLEVLDRFAYRHGDLLAAVAAGVQ